LLPLIGAIRFVAAESLRQQAEQLACSLGCVNPAHVAALASWPDPMLKLWPCLADDGSVKASYSCHRTCA
jgi:hypothetical protein